MLCKKADRTLLEPWGCRLISHRQTPQPQQQEQNSTYQQSLTRHTAAVARTDFLIIQRPHPSAHAAACQHSLLLP